MDYVVKNNKKQKDFCVLSVINAAYWSIIRLR